MPATTSDVTPLVSRHLYLECGSGGRQSDAARTGPSAGRVGRRVGSKNKPAEPFGHELPDVVKVSGLER